MRILYRQNTRHIYHAVKNKHVLPLRGNVANFFGTMSQFWTSNLEIPQTFISHRPHVGAFVLEDLLKTGWILCQQADLGYITDKASFELR